MIAARPLYNPRFMLAGKHVGGAGIYIYPLSANTANMVLPATFTPETVMFPMLAGVRISANTANTANTPRENNH